MAAVIRPIILHKQHQKQANVKFSHWTGNVNLIRPRLVWIFIGSSQGQCSSLLRFSHKYVRSWWGNLRVHRQLYNTAHLDRRRVRRNNLQQSSDVVDCMNIATWTNTKPAICLAYYCVLGNSSGMAIDASTCHAAPPDHSWAFFEHASEYYLPDSSRRLIPRC